MTKIRNSTEVKGELAAPSVPSYVTFASPVIGTELVTVLGSPGTTDWSRSGVLAPNGKVYSVGWVITYPRVLEIVPGGMSTLDVVGLLSPYVNHD